MIKNFIISTFILLISLTGLSQENSTPINVSDSGSSALQSTNPIKIGFVTEVKGFELNEMIDNTVITQLKKLKATLVINVTDFSDERAQAVSRLNEVGIPLVAWFLLPKRDRYWLNAYNGEKAFERYTQFQEWTLKEDLKWKAMALNLEAFSTDQRILDRGPYSTLKVVMKRLVSAPTQEQGELSYARFFKAIEEDNYKVINFISPFEIDNMSGNSDSWYKLNYTFAISSDQKIPCLMNYYSEDPIETMAQFISYGTEYPAVLFGSANQNKPFSNIENPRPLNWKELTQYLTITRKYDKSAFVYGLKGCIDNGILSNLQHKMIDEDLPALRTNLNEIRLERERVMLIFKLLENPLWLVIGGIIYLALTIAAFIKLFRTISKRIKS